MGRRPPGAAESTAERSRDFRGSAVRLVKRLTPQRALTVTVLLLGVGGIAIGVIGPRVLGHATDLLFNGVIGRELPAGITKQQAIDAARARGNNSFADLLSGMNVVPGRGVDFDAIGRTLIIVTHDPAWTVNADRIMHLEAGRLAADLGPQTSGPVADRRLAAVGSQLPT